VKFSDDEIHIAGASSVYATPAGRFRLNLLYPASKAGWSLKQDAARLLVQGHQRSVPWRGGRS
jgi:hypothetical protein